MSRSWDDAGVFSVYVGPRLGAAALFYLYNTARRFREPCAKGLDHKCKRYTLRSFEGATTALWNLAPRDRLCIIGWLLPAYVAKVRGCDDDGVTNDPPPPPPSLSREQLYLLHNMSDMVDYRKGRHMQELSDAIWKLEEDLTRRRWPGARVLRRSDTETPPAEEAQVGERVRQRRWADEYVDCLFEQVLHPLKTGRIVDASSDCARYGWEIEVLYDDGRTGMGICCGKRGLFSLTYE